MLLVLPLKARRLLNDEDDISRHGGVVLVRLRLPASEGRLGGRVRLAADALSRHPQFDARQLALLDVGGSG